MKTQLIFTISYLKNKILKVTMTHTFNVIIEEGEDGYLISEVVGLPGCHTQAKTYDELITRTKEAIKLYLKSKRPEESSPKFVCLQRVEVEA